MQWLCADIHIVSVWSRCKLGHHLTLRSVSNVTEVTRFSCLVLKRDYG